MLSNKDLGATIASGSHDCEAMVIVPCSMKTLAGVAHGLSRNLVERAADVMLKEQRRLVIVPRETPMSLPQLKNMVLCAEAGAMIMPAMPAFYQMPKTLDDLADFMAGKILGRSASATISTRSGKVVRRGSSPDRRPDSAPERCARQVARAHRGDVRRDCRALRLPQSLPERRPRHALAARAMREAAAAAPARASLDLCTGTADLAIAALHAAPRRASSASTSPAPCCASVSTSCAARALDRADHADPRRRDGDPCRDGWADAATIAFGIRNVARPEAGARRARARAATRRAASRSSNSASRASPASAALQLVFPRGAAAAGPARFEAPERVFVPAGLCWHVSAPAEFAATISSHGFTDVRAVPLSFGIVYLYTATRASLA